MLETLDYENMPKTLRQSLLGSFYAKMAEGNYDVPHIMRYGSTRDALPSAMILEQLIIIHGKLTMGLDCAALSTEWRIHAGEVLRTELGDDYEQMYVQAVEHSNEVLASQRIAFGKAIAELRQMIKNAPYSFKWSANNPVLKRAVRTLTCENIEG